MELEKKKYEAKEAAKINVKTTPQKQFFAFGGKKAFYEESTSNDDNNDAPITLSTTELKELEIIAMEDYYVQNELSSDSMLYDVEFYLGSFEVDLITFASQRLALFQMGSFSSSFKANVDGSFIADFNISNFNISDHITHNTLFPFVVRSLEQPVDSNSHNELQQALCLSLKKAKNGDQSLEARLVSFEIIACNVLIKECKQFITFTEEDNTTFLHAEKQNPTLEYSVSGAADVFYDASGSVSQNIVIPKNKGDFIDQKRQNRTKVSDKLTAAFTKAWKSKLEKKIAWQV